MHAPLAEDGAVSSYVIDGVADVAFGHPKSNALPANVLRALAAALDEAGRREDVRVIVLRSYGTGAFCAGASFDELRAIRGAASGTEFFMGFARVLLAMRRCPQPIVARVHGKVVGGGVGLVAAADYALATERASLRLSELTIGIGPFVVGPAIERKIGAGALAAMAIDADWRDAAWGERRGLYARLFADEALLDAAVETLSRRLAASHPKALRQIKAMTQGDSDWSRLLEERAAMSGTLVLSEFAKQAIAAFGAKR